MARSKSLGRPSYRPSNKPKRKRTTDAAYGDNWEQLSAYVRQRDNYQCRIVTVQPGWRCDVYAPPPFHHLLHVHHIIPLPRGPNHPKILITLCRNCHGKLHGKNLGEITKRQAVFVKKGGGHGR